jgi:hypothetical protein
MYPVTRDNLTTRGLHRKQGSVPLLSNSSDVLYTKKIGHIGLIMSHKIESMRLLKPKKGIARWFHKL